MNAQRKFIVLSHGRTGSTYLAKEVNRTSDLKMYFEIFHPNIAERDAANGKKFRDGSDSWKFIEENVYGTAPSRIKSTGFKLFYYHARGPQPEASIWDEIPKHGELDVVLLGRKNIFAAFVSEARARSTNVWHPSSQVSNSYGDQVAIDIDIDQASRFMARTSKYRPLGAELAKNHRTFSLEYEDLESDSVDTISGLLTFLGSADKSFVPGPFLTGSADKSKTRIGNLDEVAALLRRFDCEWMIAPYE